MIFYNLGFELDFENRHTLRQKKIKENQERINKMYNDPDIVTPILIGQ